MHPTTIPSHRPRSGGRPGGRRRAAAIVRAALLAAALVAAASGPAPLAAQEAPDAVEADRPAASPADVASTDAIVGAVYEAISGPAGEPRQWDRFRSLFVDDARLIVAGARPDGTVVHSAMTVEEYIDRAGPQLRERGFFEGEIGVTSERFGPIAHRFSAYESRQTPDADPFARGINSFQLLHDGERWWVVTILWTGERPDLEIPERYIGRR